MMHTIDPMKLSKRTLLILLLVALIPQALMVGAGSTLSVGQAAVAQASMSLSPASLSVPAQTVFTVDIMVNCDPGADGAAAKLTFDPACLQVVSITPDTSAFLRVLRNTYDNETGTVLYDAVPSLDCHVRGNCPVGLVRLATVSFRAVALTPQVTYIRLDGQVTWGEEFIFDGEGSGSTVDILAQLYNVYLPLVMHDRR